MLSSFRKFSSSFFAKIFLFIIAIPFVFWGMGPLFTGGNLNTIVKIGNEKVSTHLRGHTKMPCARHEVAFDEGSTRDFSRGATQSGVE